MRKYSPALALMAIITAMVIFQIGVQGVGASSATISSKSNQMDRPAISGGPLMVPMDTRLAKGKGDDKDSDDDDGKKDEDKKDERGGFDRLWDVISNG